jgi:hypothetical protein
MTTRPRPSTSDRKSQTFGGYSGSTPAAKMPPPARIPSSFAKPNGRKAPATGEPKR